MSQEKISKWYELKVFFRNRLYHPKDHPEFFIYFFLVIIGFGAIDVWSNWYQEYHHKVFNHFNIINSLLSFSVALIATGSIELMFVENKFIRYPLFLISVTILLGGGILFLVFINTNQYYVYWIALPFSIFSLYIWWISNAENANLTKNFFVEQSENSKSLDQSLDGYEEQ